MQIPWGIIIALAILVLALLIKHLGIHVIEDDHHFQYILIGFLILYIGAAVSISILNPKVSLTDTVFAAQTTDDLQPDTPTWTERVRDFFRVPLPRS